jgi:hypothetical protein
MRLIMKGLKLVGLSVAIWGLSLLWPEVNLVLAPPAMIGVVLGLGGAVLVTYALDQHLDQRHDQKHKAGQDDPPQPTPPTPAALTRSLSV